MSTRQILNVIRELMRGRLKITKETTDVGSRITICADRTIAILAVVLIVVIVVIIVSPAPTLSGCLGRADLRPRHGKLLRGVLGAAISIDPILRLHARRLLRHENR